MGALRNLSVKAELKGQPEARCTVLSEGQGFAKERALGSRHHHGAHGAKLHHFGHHPQVCALAHPLAYIDNSRHFRHIVVVPAGRHLLQVLNLLQLPLV